MLADISLHPSDSILDEPSVRAASRFAGYVGGGHLVPGYGPVIEKAAPLPVVVPAPRAVSAPASQSSTSEPSSKTSAAAFATTVRRHTSRRRKDSALVGEEDARAALGKAAGMTKRK